MSLMRPVLLVMLVAALLGACGSRETTTGSWNDWQRLDNAYAQCFQVWRHGADRLVLVFGHGGERDTVGVYWFADHGSEIRPPVGSTGFGHVLSAVALGSTTHVPYINALGQGDAVTACAHMDQVRDTAFQTRVRSGTVKEIATGDGLDREALLALKPEALFGYPFSQGETHALEGLGIPTIEVSEYLEEHPLGRAEWLRFFGVLFGEEHKADSLFAGIRERYEALRVDSAMTDRPTVLFGSVWQGQWWVPPGNSYIARLIEDAGGRYVFADRKGDGNIAMDMETMITRAGKADWWGMIAALDHEASVTDFTGADPRLSTFRAMQDSHLFLGNSMKEDLFGQALLEPDVVLMSLREAMDPFLIIDGPSGYRPKYFAGMYQTPPSPRIRTERFEAVQ